MAISISINYRPSLNDSTLRTTGIGSLGIRLQLLIGQVIPSPAPLHITESIKSVEVTNSDRGRSGFQMTFTLGKGSGGVMSEVGVTDYSLFNSSLLKPFARVVIIISIGLSQRVLMDGFITHYQFSPSDSPGASTLTVTGEDYSVMMDMVELSVSHPAQPDIVIVNKIILRYGLVPIVIPPLQFIVPDPIRDIPQQNGTDLGYIQQLAAKYNYIFYVQPTDTPGLNTAYWGPSIRMGISQKAITVNMGSFTNASSISIQSNALEPKSVFGLVQDKRLQNIPIPIIATVPLPPYLASEPAHLSNQPFVKKKIFKSKGGTKDAVDAYIKAMADVDNSKDVVTVSGELDTLRYGDVLQSRKLVSVRGVGDKHDGLYYVKNVTHKIEQGSYKQSFSLTREGNGSTIAGVVS